VKREQLEHVLRAASRTIEDPDLLVIGSAAILGSYDDDDLPIEATRSDEADIAALDNQSDDRSHEIEGSLGASPFHEQFGYFADGWTSRQQSFQPAGESSWFCMRRQVPSLGVAGASSRMTSLSPSSSLADQRTSSSSALWQTLVSSISTSSGCGRETCPGIVPCQPSSYGPSDGYGIAPRIRRE
jgi:hypothetical protein